MYVLRYSEKNINFLPQITNLHSTLTQSSHDLDFAFVTFRHLLQLKIINAFRGPNDLHFDVNDDGPYPDHRGRGPTFYHGGPGGVNCASAIEDHGPSLFFCPGAIHVHPHHKNTQKKKNNFD
jgi:hypothetical protein